MRLARMSLSGFAMVLLWLCSALQAQSPIHLRHGTYVERSTPCKDAPFAVMKSWDGVGFGGPHSSRCTVKVTAKQGTTFHIADTCSALGDGTPATPDTERAIVTVLGPESFRYGRKVPSGTDTAVYRWCSVH